MKTQEHLNLLGMSVKDKVTGFKGAVTCISFDLYGCIQAIVVLQVNKEGKYDGKWFDVSRLIVTKKNHVMDVPNYDNVYSPIAQGLKGPEEKPIK